MSFGETVFLNKFRRWSFFQNFGFGGFIGNDFRRFFARFGGKTITAFGNCLDIILAVRVFAESFSQSVDAKSKVRFLDKSISPNRLHQIVAADEFATLFNQKNQQIKDFRLKRNGLTASLQTLLFKVKQKQVKLVNLFIHWTF